MLGPERTGAGEVEGLVEAEGDGELEGDGEPEGEGEPEGDEGDDDVAVGVGLAGVGVATRVGAGRSSYGAVVTFTASSHAISGPLASRGWVLRRFNRRSSLAFAWSLSSVSRWRLAKVAFRLLMGALRNGVAQHS